MMAALNGLYVARMPVPESPAEDGAKAATDERVRCSLLIYGWNFYDFIPLTGYRGVFLKDLADVRLEFVCIDLFD